MALIPTKSELLKIKLCVFDTWFCNECCILEKYIAKLIQVGKKIVMSLMEDCL